MTGEERHDCSSSPIGVSRLGFVGQYGAHVLGAFEGGGVRAALLAHAAPQLVYRLVLVLFHPLDHSLFDLADMSDPALQQYRAKLGYVCARHQDLQDVSELWIPLVAAISDLIRPYRIATQRSGRRSA